MKGEVRFPLTVYYDASCPMCASEMHALRNAAGHDVLRLADCSASDFDIRVLPVAGVTKAELMTRLHACDAEGRLLVAMEVYEATYRAAGYRMAAGLWGARVLRPLLDRVFLWVARNRNAISRMGANHLVRWLLHR